MSYHGNELNLARDHMDGYKVAWHGKLGVEENMELLEI